MRHLVARCAITRGVFVVLGLTTVVASADEAWRQQFKVGDRVELHISGDHWQRCVVSENHPDSVLRGRCEEFVESPPGTYRRAGGTYILSQSDTRHAGRVPAAAPAPTARPATPAPATPMGRGTGQLGPIPTPPPAARPATAAGLKVGEYACYGSGGRIMVGLGFRVLPGGRYTDLEDGNPGTFTITGGAVSFRGGHLGGQTGRDLRGHSFTIGAQAECEPY